MTRYLYDPVSESWEVVTDEAFATKELAEQYVQGKITLCQASQYCKCGCGKHKENGDY
jgi:hypothetical protein